MKEFKDRLHEAITKSKITASELSRISGVGKSDISNYMKGKYLPKQDKCYLLAEALNVDPGWLMTGFEPKHEETVTNEEPIIPKNEDIRLLIRGLNKLSPEQIDQAKAMFKVMFAPQYAELFTKENDDDT